VEFPSKGLVAHHISEKGDELCAGARAAVLPSTSPVAVFNAAKQAQRAVALALETVTLGRPRDSGNCDFLRSRAWMRSFRPRRRPPRALEDSGTARSRRPPCSRSLDRWRPCAARAAGQLTHDRLARGALIEQQDQSRPPHLTHGHRAAALPIHQFPPLGLAQIRSSHAPTTGCIFIGQIDLAAW
jgi:hypothetical protein